MVMRVGADEPVTLSIAMGGREVGEVSLAGETGWVERAVELPAGGGKVAITVSAKAPRGGRFHAFHYWFYAR
jgi:hypothetical protein